MDGARGRSGRSRRAGALGVRAVLLGALLLWALVPGLALPGGAVGATPSNPSAPTATAAAVPSAWSSLSTGHQRACAVAADHTLWCWGLNERGATGNGTRSRSSETPEQVGADATWVWVSTGWRTTCAIRLDESLWCWGDNVLGTAGTGLTGPILLTPEQVAPGSRWRSVATAGLTTCGVQVDGSGWCWGDNTSGQLGTTTAGGRATPTAVPGPALWRQVVPGLRRTCGITDDGALWCWGGSLLTLRTAARVGTESDWVEVALARSEVRRPYSYRPSPYLPGPGKPVVADGCARGADGRVACWAPTTARPKPAEVPGVTGSTAVAVGDTSACSTSGAQLLCWGFGDGGQLGNGSRADRTAPVVVAGTTAWAAVSVGEDFACGLDTDAAAHCWGSHALAAPTLLRAEVPVRLGTAPPAPSGPVGGWRSIDTSTSHSCGVGRDGSLWCWGDPTDGALGVGALWWRTAYPQRVGADRTWRSVSVAQGTACAVATDATLWCWGRTRWGVIGTMSGLASDDRPTAVLPGSTWTAVSVDSSGTCAVRTGGVVWCWGWQGRLGRGNGDVRVDPEPEPVAESASGERFAAASLSLSISGCAVATDAHLWCWSRRAPEDVSGGLSWQSVVVPTSENGTICGVTTAGALLCGGRPGFTRQPGSWRSVTADQSSRCGLQTDGSLWCWGANRRGEAGLGLRGPVTAPTRVGAGTWLDVSLADRTTCAVDTEHVGWCWGDNRSGQLGDGTTTSRLTPTRVEVAS